MLAHCSLKYFAHLASSLPIIFFLFFIHTILYTHPSFDQGMVDPGELVTSTLKREFLEEALNGLELNSSEKSKLEEQLSKWMSPDVAVEVFRGMVVNDHRNTDNAWMETVVSHFHDETGTTFGTLNLNAGDDAQDVKWMDLSSDMAIFSDHRNFISLVAQRVNCHW